ncbi:MAG: LPS assembly lipoprotein LptE [Sulfitobacter sp.]
MPRTIARSDALDLEENRKGCNRRIMLLAPLVLAACGFEPVYAPGGSGATLQNRVAVDPPGSQDSYLLVRELENRLGRSDDPAFALSMVINTSQAQLAIDREGDTGRFNRIANVQYSLRNLATGQILTSGKVENFVGYSATGTTVETLAGEQNSQERLMNIMADQIVDRLYAADLSI